MSIESFDKTASACWDTNYLRKYSATPVCTTTRETGSKRVFRKVFHFATRVSSLAVWQNVTIVSCQHGHFFHENKSVVSQNTYSYVTKIVPPFPFQGLITGVTVSRVR